MTDIVCKDNPYQIQSRIGSRILYVGRNPKLVALNAPLGITDCLGNPFRLTNGEPKGNATERLCRAILTRDPRGQAWIRTIWDNQTTLFDFIHNKGKLVCHCHGDYGCHAHVIASLACFAFDQPKAVWLNVIEECITFGLGLQL